MFRRLPVDRVARRRWRARVIHRRRHDSDRARHAAAPDRSAAPICSVIEELGFIKKAQALGFSLEEIGEILELTRAGRTACAHVLDLARRHVAAVDERIWQLTRFRDQLAGEVAKWDGKAEPTCAGLCQIIANAPVDPGSNAPPALGGPSAPRRSPRGHR